MSLPYLLPLAELHAAAPGVLGVVFGPDGDFEGAPRWRGPILTATGAAAYVDVIRDGMARVIRCDDLPDEIGTAHGTMGSGGWHAFEGLTFDLRTSAADRLARLCALVCLKCIGATEAPVSVYVYDDWERCGLEVHTSGVDPYKQRNFCWDGADGGGNDHFVNGEKRELFALPVEVVARPQPDPISFLRALTLTLAPRMLEHP